MFKRILALLFFVFALFWPFVLMAVVLALLSFNPYALAVACSICYTISFLWSRWDRTYVGARPTIYSRLPLMSLILISFAFTLASLILLFVFNWVVALITIPAGLIVGAILPPVLQILVVKPTIMLFHVYFDLRK